MEIIECPYCKEMKDDIEDFYWRKEKRQLRCKSCQKLYSVEWNRQNRKRLQKEKEKYILTITSESVQKTYL